MTETPTGPQITGFISGKTQARLVATRRGEQIEIVCVTEDLACTELAAIESLSGWELVSACLEPYYPGVPRQGGEPQLEAQPQPAARSRHAAQSRSAAQPQLQRAARTSWLRLRGRIASTHAMDLWIVGIGGEAALTCKLLPID